MNKQITILILMAIFCSGGYMFLAYNPPAARAHHVNHQHEGEAEDEQQSIEAAMEQEFLKTHDPFTNTIPRERMFAALDYLEKAQAVRSAMKGTDVANYNTITWTNRGPTDIGGRTRSLIFDANDATHARVFAGSVGGGIWRCNDITAALPTWTPVSDQFANLAVTTIAQDPTTPATIYFGTGEGFFNVDAIKGGGIWKSTDGGTTFARLSATAGATAFDYVEKIIVTSGGNIYAATRSSSATGGIMKSTDGGVSFTRVIGTATSDNRGADLEIGSNGDLLATVGIFSTGRIYRSLASLGTAQGNSGNWVNVTPTLSFTPNRIELGTGPSTTVYALFHNPTTNQCDAIRSSTDNGTTWITRTVPTFTDGDGSTQNFCRDQAWYDMICVVDPVTPTTVYIGGIDQYKSTNSGTSWTRISSWYSSGSNYLHADQHSLALRPGATSTSAIYGNDGGIGYTSNLSNAAPGFSDKDNSYVVTQYYATSTHPTDANYYLAGAQDNGTERFTGTPPVDAPDVIGGDGAFNFIDKLNGNNQIASYIYNNYYISTNNGLSFIDLNGNDNTGQFINPADLDNTNKILYSADAANQIARFTNVFSSAAGTSTAVRTAVAVLMGGQQATAIKVSPNTPTTVYVGNGVGNVYRITNANGASPTVTTIAASLGSSGNISNIDVWKKVNAPINDDSIVVSVSNYGVLSVYLSINGSNATPTFTAIDDNSTLPDIPVRWATFSAANNNIIFLATEVGVFGSKKLNGTATQWQQINNGVLPQVRSDMIQFNSNKEMAVATHGRGLWTSSTVTPLPIKLLAFSAVTRDNDVLLQWQVANNKSTASYSVERQYSDEPDFSPVAQLPAGNTDHYQTTDLNPDWRHGPLFYRLKCTDLDGEVIYSAVQRLVKNAKGIFISSVYPTVTNNTVQINVGDAGSLALNIALVNTSGALMMKRTAPYQNTVIQLGEFAAGMYFMVITDAEGKYRQVSRIEKK